MVIMFGKPSIYNIALFSLIVLENLFFFIFYKEGYLSSSANAIGYCSVSILIGIILILKYYNKNIQTDSIPVSKNIFIALMLFIVSAIWLGIKSYAVFIDSPIDAKMSDILPTIEILTKRFWVTGQSPYDRGALIWLGYNIPSTYLPMHWLPYCIAEFFKFDYRWITFSVWMLGFFFIVSRAAKQKKISNSILVIALLSSAYFLITDKYPNIIAYSIETMIAGYYMILMASMNQKNGYILGIAIGVCLLSRYSLVLWLPLLAFVLFASENKQLLYRSIIASVLFVVTIYIIPYLSHDWTAFYDAHMAYETNAVGEWYHNNEQNLPYHLFNGVGFAQFFYIAYVKTDLHVGYTALRSTLFVSIFISSAILGVWFWFNKKRINYKIFLMASFKIYITIVFTLIMVPYLYLLVIGNFISIAIFAEQLKYIPVKVNDK